MAGLKSYSSERVFNKEGEIEKGLKRELSKYASILNLTISPKAENY